MQCWPNRYRCTLSSHALPLLQWGLLRQLVARCHTNHLDTHTFSMRRLTIQWGLFCSLLADRSGNLSGVWEGRIQTRTMKRATFKWHTEAWNNKEAWKYGARNRINTAEFSFTWQEAGHFCQDKANNTKDSGKVRTGEHELRNTFWANAVSVGCSFHFQHEGQPLQHAKSMQKCLQ